MVMRLTTAYIKDSMEDFLPKNREIEVEDWEGNRLPIEKVYWTMEEHEAGGAFVAKFIIKLEDDAILLTDRIEQSE